MSKLVGTEKQIAWSLKILEDLKKQFVNKCHWFEGIDQEKLFDFVDSIEDCKTIIEKRGSIEYFVSEYKETLDCENYEQIRNDLLKDEKIVRSLIRNILSNKLSMRVQSEIDIFNKRYQKLFLEEACCFINANFNLHGITVENVKTITSVDLNTLVDTYFNSIVSESAEADVKIIEETSKVETRKETIKRIKDFKKMLKITKVFAKSEIESFISQMQNTNYKTVQTEITNLRRLSK